MGHVTLLNHILIMYSTNEWSRTNQGRTHLNKNAQGFYVLMLPNAGTLRQGTGNEEGKVFLDLLEGDPVHVLSKKPKKSVHMHAAGPGKLT